MTQLETLERAAAIMTTEWLDGVTDDLLEIALIEVLNATIEVKRWEAEEGDVSECACRQCAAAVAFAEAIIREEERDD